VADVNGNAVVSVTTSATNAGTIDLTSGGCGCNPTKSELAIGSSALPNTGTIEATSSGCNLCFGEVAGNLDNQGTLSAAHTLALDRAAATYTNTDAVTIASGRNLTMSGGNEIFNFNGGTISSTGVFTQTGGSSTHNAGTASGVNLQLANLTLSANPSSGSAQFDIMSRTTLSGNVSAGDTLNIVAYLSGGATLTVASSITNAGTIALTDGNCACNFTAELSISSVAGGNRIPRRNGYLSARNGSC
jgi:hypothetical protein